MTARKRSAIAFLALMVLGALALGLWAGFHDGDWNFIRGFVAFCLIGATAVAFAVVIE